MACPIPKNCGNKTLADFIRVAALSEMQPGQRKLVELDEITVALFNIGGELYCIEDICSHDGGPLADGTLDGYCLECPRHGAQFDVRDGSVLSMPAVVPVPTYEVKIQGVDIFVESPDDW